MAKLRVKRLINRNFSAYAIRLEIPNDDKSFLSWDKSTYCHWLSKKDAVKVSEEIRRIFTSD